MKLSIEQSANPIYSAESKGMDVVDLELWWLLRAIRKREESG